MNMTATEPHASLFCGTFSNSAYVWSIIKVEFDLMWETKNKANQIFNPTKKDDLPGCFANKLYVVTDPADDKYRVTVKADIEPAAIRTDCRCAVFDGGTKVAGSDTSFDATGEVDLEFADPSSAKAKTDFVVRVGHDSNGNGALDSSEHLDFVVVDSGGDDIGDPIIRGINQAEYDEAEDSVDGMIDTGFWQYPAGIVVPHATKCMARIFRDGSASGVPSSKQPDSQSSVTLDAFQNATPSSSCFSEWLTHNSGAPFSDAGVASIVEYYWNSDRSLAELLAYAQPINPFDQWADQPNLENFYATTVASDAVAYFQANPAEVTVWLPQNSPFYLLPSKEDIDQQLGYEEPSEAWVPTQTVNVFREPALGYYDDAKASMHRGRLNQIKRQFLMMKYTDGGQLKCKLLSIRCVGELADLYDWSSEDTGAFGRASDCATLQIGYGNGTYGRTQGRIFRVRVEIDEAFSNTFADPDYPPVLIP